MICTNAEERRVLGHVEHAQREHRARPGTAPSGRRCGPNTMPSAPTSASGPRIQNVTASPTPVWAPPGTVSPPGASSEQSTHRTCSAAPRPDTSEPGSHRRRASVGPCDVVVLLVVAQPHRVRRLLHARQQRGEQLLLGVDQVLPVVVGQLVLVGHGQRAGRAGLDAQAAADAAQVVDLVDRAVPLTRASSAPPRCCRRPRRRSRRPGRPTRTARSRRTSPARPDAG